MLTMKFLAAVLFPLCVGASYSTGQVPFEVDPPDLPNGQTTAGTTFVHFEQVDEGVYKGSKPRTDADFQFLQSRHVKYIVDLQFLPFLDVPEQRKAQRYGIMLIPARMNASPVSPSQKHIEAVLAILRKKSYHPVYFHCALGRDRTSLIAALYKMYFLGMSQQDAWRYMKESGYQDSWVRGGLKRYLEKHATPSPALLSSAY